jgi:ribosome-binding factor A
VAPSYRHEKLQDELRRLISEIVATQSHDPRLTMVSVTRVTLSRDLSLAKVYVSRIGGEERGREAVRALVGARGFVRSTLASRMRIKRVPHLEFRYDPSISEAARIHELLDGCARPTDS